MFWKLVVCLLAIGVMGCSLLAMRQSRLQAAHELAQTQLRIRACDERLFKLRAQIGARVRPEDVRSLVSGIATLKPLTPAAADSTQTPGGAPRPGQPTTSDPRSAPITPAESKPRTRVQPSSNDEARLDDLEQSEPLYALDSAAEDGL